MVLHPDMPSPSLNKMVELARTVNEVNSLEPGINSLSDLELKAKTQEFREHLSNRSKEYQERLEELRQSLLAVAMPEEKDRIKESIKLTRNKIFEEVLAQAFAVVREASRRTIGLRHFDVQ
ncbi:MAG: hypothetical protein FJZ08_03640, partial [Candidatus Omnitrophica bacterium]|nr:hypothetical protein [Candidatus Omnitrophota bacterium]